MKTYLRLVLFLVALVCCSLADSAERRWCGGADFTFIGDMSLHNDVYGAKNLADASENYYQCMMVSDAKDEGFVRYEWSYKLRSNGVKSYPHVSYGWDWQGARKDKVLPVRVGSADQLVFDYDYRIDSDAPYNVSFDVWISNSGSEPGRKELRAEVMVWVKDHDTKLLKDKGEVVTIDGAKYRLVYRKANPNVGDWMYFAFVAQQESSAGRVNIGSFLAHLSSRGLLENSSYVNGVSFGAELIEGRGSFLVKKFEYARSK